MSSDQVTARQLQQLKSRLQELRSSIVVQLDLSGDRDVPVELDQNRQGRLSRMDALQGQAMLKAGLQRLRSKLQEVDTALQRIDQPDFGRCHQCDEWIAIARLQLDPTATLCIACATLSERGVP